MNYNTCNQCEYFERYQSMRTFGVCRNSESAANGSKMYSGDSCSNFKK